MTFEYEKPVVTVVSFIAMAQLATGDDSDRARTATAANDDDFNPGLESSVFG